MKYFTPDRFIHLQDFDPAAMDAADAQWEAAEEQYEEHLRQLQPEITPLLQKFEGVLLHDAQVWSIIRHDDRFSMVLLKDIPPQDVVTLTYTLTAAPLIDRAALPPAYRSNVMQFQYDEFDLLREG